MRRRSLRGGVLLALSLWSTGCFHYVPMGRLEQTTPLPREIRLQIYDGTVEFLAESRMVNDTIFGIRTRGGRVTIPLAYVDDISEKKFHVVDSMLIGTIAGVLFVGLVRSIRARPVTGGL